MGAFHSNQTTSDGIHIITKWVYSTTAARDVASYDTTDEGGVSRVGNVPPYDFYLLTDSSVPTWLQLGSGSSGGGSGGGDPGATYVVISTTGSLSNERVLTAGTGVEIVDGGVGSTVTLLVDDDIVATLTGSQFSGPIIAGGGLSGSLQNLADGSSYLVGIGSVTITSQSNGQIIISGSGGSGGSSDHGTLSGLSDDDHTQYLLVDGTRHVSGELIASGGVVVPLGTGLSGSLQNLADGSSYLVGAGTVTVISQSNGQIIISGSGDGSGGSGDGADPAAPYIVVSTTSSLANERALAAGTGITLADAGANGNLTVSIDDNVIATLSGSEFSGPINAAGGLSGSLQRLSSGETYLAAAGSVTIITGSNGQLLISGSGRQDTDYRTLVSGNDTTPDLLVSKLVAGANVSIVETNDGGSETLVIATDSAADNDATYVVLSATGSLSAERVLTAGTGVDITDAGAGSTVTVAVDNEIVATLTGSQFTGPVEATGGLSGSLQNLTDGSSYLVGAGTITILSESSGQVIISSSGGVGAGVSDHGALTGLADDDHTQYLHVSGSREMSAPLNLGNNNLTSASWVDLDLITSTSLIDHREGRLFYDVHEHALAIYNDKNDVTHQLGQEFFIRVGNVTGNDIDNGSVVYISGTIAEDESGVARPAIALAQSNDLETSRVIGLTTHTIANNEFGYVTNRGIVNGIDLSSFSLGDLTFLSETSSGSLRVGPPPAGNYNALIGGVIDNSVNGKLMVIIERDLSQVAGAASQASTGLINGGVLSVNALNSASFDLTSGSGQIIDAFTSPGEVNVQTISWVSASASSITDLASSSFTWIGIDSGSNITQISDRAPTAIEARTKIWLGRLGHPNNDFILAAANRPFGAIQPSQTGADLARAIGPFNIEGNIFSANGVNLQLDKTEGRLFLYGSGFQDDNRSPNEVTLAETSALTFSYRYRDGSGEWISVSGQTEIDPANYDDGTGTLASVGGNSDWSIQRIYVSATGGVIIYYGQDSYGTLDNARNNIETAVDLDPALGETVFRAWLLVEGDATDLTAAQQEFITVADGPGSAQSAGVAGITSHDQLANLSADDHAQYVLVDGSRAMTGELVASGGITVPLSEGLSGSLQNLADGSSYLVGIGSVFITTQSNGQIILSGSGAGGADTSNHGLLSGLDDDDHPHYLNVSGTNQMIASLHVGSNDIVSASTITFSSEYDNGISSGSIAIDWSNSQKQRLAISGTVTASFSAPDGVGNFLLKLVHSSSSDLISWPASVKWPAATAPTLSTTTGSVDIVTFYHDGESYFGGSSLNYQ